MIKRVGRFTVSDKLLWDIAAGKCGTTIFHGMVPLDVNKDFMQMRTEFFCAGPMFDEVPEGQCIPEYKPIWQSGKTLPEWRRIWE